MHTHISTDQQFSLLNKFPRDQILPLLENLEPGQRSYIIINLELRSAINLQQLDTNQPGRLPLITPPTLSKPPNNHESSSSSTFLSPKIIERFVPQGGDPYVTNTPKSTGNESPPLIMEQQNSPHSPNSQPTNVLNQPFEISDSPQLLSKPPLSIAQTTFMESHNSPLNTIDHSLTQQGNHPLTSLPFDPPLPQRQPKRRRRLSDDSLLNPLCNMNW